MAAASLAKNEFGVVVGRMRDAPPSVFVPPEAWRRVPNQPAALETDNMRVFRDACDAMHERFGAHGFSQPNRQVVDFVTQDRDRFADEHINFEGMFARPPASYQTDALRNIFTRLQGRVLVAFEMGGGKTMMGSGCVAHYDTQRTNSLIVAPASILGKWKTELEQWYGITNVTVFRKGAQKLPRDTIVITTFDLAKTRPELLDRTWTCVVVDECHKLSGTGTARSLNLVPMLQRATSCVLLSGTPQKAKPIELYNLLSALHPHLFTYEEFAVRYCAGFVDNYGKFVCSGHKQEEELNLVLSCCMIRALKTDVLPDLPSKTREVVRLDLAPEAVAFFATERAKQAELRKTASALQNLAESSAKEVERAQNEQKAHSMYMWRKSGELKLPAAFAWFLALYQKLQADANTQNDKFVLFAYHTATIGQLTGMLTAAGIAHVCVTGAVDPKKRQGLLDCMRDEAHATKVCVLGLGACAEGLDLQGAANRVVFFELIHTPAIMDQAEDRVHRPGAHKPIETYWLLGKDTHDESVYRTLSCKRQLNDRIVDGGATKHQKLAPEASQSF